MLLASIKKSKSELTWFTFKLASIIAYSGDASSCIISYDLSTVKLIGEDNLTVENGVLNAEDFFPSGSSWKKRLLHSNVSIYAACTGCKCCLKQLCKIRCSFYETSVTNTNFSSGSINKGCTWMICMKASKHVGKKM